MTSSQKENRRESPSQFLATSVLIRELKSSSLYHDLSASLVHHEGNLLESPDHVTMKAQIDAIRYVLDRVKPRRLLETGTNKCMFALALSHLLMDVTLFTFDQNPDSARAVEIVNRAQNNVRVVFTAGDTKETLPLFREPNIDIAWIDGGHDESTAYSDIQNAIRLDVSLVMVDDTRLMPGVARAVEAVMASERGYRPLPNPFAPNDAWGIVLLERAV